MSAKRALKVGIIALVALRATRFFTSDTLGEWTVVGPMKRWAARHEEPNVENVRQIEEQVANAEPADTPHPGNGWRSKLVSAFDCPFCVGFWMTTILLLLSPLTKLPVIGKLMKWIGGALAMNYVTGHISSRVDH